MSDTPQTEPVPQAPLAIQQHFDAIERYTKAKASMDNELIRYSVSRVHQTLADLVNDPESQNFLKPKQPAPISPANPPTTSRPGKRKK